MSAERFDTPRTVIPPEEQTSPRSGEELLELIFGYVEKISETRTNEAVIELLANMGRELVDADRCTVWLWDKHNQEIVTQVAQGISTGELRLPDDSGLVGHCIQSGKELIVNDPYKDSRFNKQTDRETGYVTREIMVIPMRNNIGEVIGAFQVLNKLTGDQSFKPVDLSRLRLAASYAGKSIESFLLNIEVEKTQREVIHILGTVSESRSRETGNHIKRVSAYSGIIATHMGMSEDEVALIKLAAPMHDLGKVSIPDSILHKPGRLTPEEFATMQEHSSIGFEILKDSNRKLLRTAAIIALQHHERHDGAGYPNKLNSEEIHPFARIVAAADVFDALISYRVYKPAWEPEKVFALFREERGRQFHPDVVDAFFEGLPEIMEIKELLDDEVVPPIV